MVLYHAFTPYLGWQYAQSDLQPRYNSIFLNYLWFILPLFTFVSGCLFSYLFNEKGKYTNVAGFIQKKFFRLILPYFVFSLLMGLTLSNLTWFALFNGYEHLWFMVMLFWCFVAARCLIQIKFVQKNLILQLAILGISFFVSLKFYPQNYLYLDYFVRYFCWFWAGYVFMLHKSKLTGFFSTRNMVILFAGYILACILVDLFVPQSDSIYGYKNGFRYDILKYISYSCFILFAYISIHKVVTRKNFVCPVWIEQVNACSYGIYIFHHWIIRYAFSANFPYQQTVFRFAELHPIIFPITAFLVMFILSFAITKLLLYTKTGRFLIG
jgi:hypothetical protein